MSKTRNIEDADFVVDLSGGRLAAQKYRKRIAELQAKLDKHRWIPVEERLPNKDGFYLVFPSIENCPALYYQGDWHWYDHTDDAICETIGHNMDEPIPIITHWKPIILPEGE